MDSWARSARVASAPVTTRILSATDGGVRVFGCLQTRFSASVAGVLDVFRYYFGRLLQLSGLLLTAYVVILFFDPMNKESRLLMMTAVGAAVFAAGHLLLGAQR